MADRIKITTHGGGVFCGSYWLEGVDWSGDRPTIRAHFDPVDARVTWDDARRAAQWLVENRADMAMVTIQTENGASYFEARA